MCVLARNRSDDLQWDGFDDFYLATLRWTGANVSGTAFIPANAAYDSDHSYPNRQSEVLRFENFYGLPTCDIVMDHKNYTHVVFNVSCAPTTLAACLLLLVCP